MRVTGWNVIFALGAIIGAYFLSWLALYTTFTPVGSTSVNGFQARYCIPIAAMIYFVIMSTKKVQIDFANKRIKALSMMALFAISVWMYIYSCVMVYI